MNDTLRQAASDKMQGDWHLYLAVIRNFGSCTASATYYPIATDQYSKECSKDTNLSVMNYDARSANANRWIVQGYVMQPSPAEEQCFTYSSSPFKNVFYISSQEICTTLIGKKILYVGDELQWYMYKSLLSMVNDTNTVRENTVNKTTSFLCNEEVQIDFASTVSPCEWFRLVESNVFDGYDVVVMGLNTNELHERPTSRRMSEKVFSEAASSVLISTFPILRERECFNSSMLELVKYVRDLLKAKEDKQERFRFFWRTTPFELGIDGQRKLKTFKVNPMPWPWGKYHDDADYQNLRVMQYFETSLPRKVHYIDAHKLFNKHPFLHNLRQSNGRVAGSNSDGYNQLEIEVTDFTATPGPIDDWNRLFVFQLGNYYHHHK